MKANYIPHLDFISRYHHLCVCVVNEILSHTGTTNIIGTNIKSTKKKEIIYFPLL